MSLHKPTLFAGACTALITPFRDGEIDYPALKELIEMQLEGDISAILVAGTTGESATLSTKEYHDLTAFAKQQIKGRVPLITGCGSNSTAHAIELAKAACAGGADALLAVTPYYNKASDRGLLLHYRALADAAEKPLILYNVPSRTGYHITMKLYRELATHENIVAVKEASGDLSLMEALCFQCGEDLDVYCGNDEQTVASMKLGAKGVISVCSNLMPREMVQICSHCLAGEYRQAGARQHAIYEKIRALFWEVNPIPVKYVASLMGLCAPEYRLPLCPPAGDTAKKLKKMFFE